MDDGSLTKRLQCYTLWQSQKGQLQFLLLNTFMINAFLSFNCRKKVLKNLLKLQRLYDFNVLFVPYFRLLVFGILVTLVAWFSTFFCFAHLTLQNVNKDYQIFLYFWKFVAKNKKWDELNKYVTSKRLWPHNKQSRHVDIINWYYNTSFITEKLSYLLKQ